MGRTCHLVLHFDGSRFVGWQRQSIGRSVQGEVERILERLTGRRVVAHAAGRTDAGVHAVGMSVSCSVPMKWTPAALRKGMNALLPTDCWVESIREAPTGFHARKCATERRYYYDVGTTEAAASPFRAPYEWALGRALDQPALHRATGCLPGGHDFAALAVKSSARPDTRCDIRYARWIPLGDREGFRFEVGANRFLHHMVRILVGTMVDIGLGRRPVDDLSGLLDGHPGLRASPPAPAQGLFFAAAVYPAGWTSEETDSA